MGLGLGSKWVTSQSSRLPHRGLWSPSETRLPRNPAKPVILGDVAGSTTFSPVNPDTQMGRLYCTERSISDFVDFRQGKTGRTVKHSQKELTSDQCFKKMKHCWISFQVNSPVIDLSCSVAAFKKCNHALTFNCTS